VVILLPDLAFFRREVHRLAPWFALVRLPPQHHRQQPPSRKSSPACFPAPIAARANIASISTAW
jgi:hypothetical protein